jgi:hypothetical protein
MSKRDNVIQIAELNSRMERKRNCNMGVGTIKRKAKGGRARSSSSLFSLAYRALCYYYYDCGVNIDGVWMGNRVYYILTTHKYKY